MEVWKNPETIFRWTLIALVFFGLFVAFLFLLVSMYIKKIVASKVAEAQLKVEYQQNLLANSVATQEKERKRFAADLHDDLIGKLSVVKLQQEVYHPTDTNTLEMIQDSIQTARRISHDLSPPLLEFSSLSELLKETMEKRIDKYDIHCHCDIRSSKFHSSEFKIQCLRIVQELLTNADKYAAATELHLHLRQTNAYTLLKLSDNGVGFDVDQSKGGLGMSNIETRVDYLKGHFKFKSVQRKGTSALFVFPAI